MIGLRSPLDCSMDSLRKQFPILQEKLNGKPLLYLDSAATTQKPLTVIKAIEEFYLHKNASAHRGIYKLAGLATETYENTRKNVATFINAKSPQEIIFLRGTTEAINLVASSFGAKNFKENDEIIISTMEHHSNIVPWQMIAKKTGAKLKVIELHENGELDLDHYEKLLNQQTKIVAITHISNTLGTINPIKKIIASAHAHNVPVLIDGAQAVAHRQVDVQDLDCDFYAFSAHKMYGPTGIGILYGKEELLDAMPPYQGGGGMIKKVTFAKTEYAKLPQKFEAGTPNVADAVGLNAATEFINEVGISSIVQHEKELLKQATETLNKIEGLKIIGNAKEKSGVISFVLDRIHAHDIATILDAENIAIRAGHHCTMPLMDFYGIAATSRISFGLYNSKEEIDILATAIEKVKKILLY